MIANLKPYPALKASGVPWLGDVPEHWEVQQLGRIGRLSKGNGGSKADEVSEGIPCVRYGDLYTRHEFFIRRAKACVAPERAASYTTIRSGDVLFAASGETIEDIGRSAENLLDHPARCGGDVLLFRPTSTFESGFLGYATDSPASRNQKACMGRGFTVVHIYASELKGLVLAVPPLAEQATIVRLLDHADRRIRRYISGKRNLIALLNEQKQAIIHRAVPCGLDPNVRLKPSGVEWLGDVPEHWQITRFRTVLAMRIRNGLYKSREHYGDGGTPIVQMGEAFALPIIARSAADRVRLSREEKEAWNLSEGDLLFARRSIVFEGSGKCSMVGKLPEPHVFESSMIRARPDPRRVVPEFLFYFFRSGFSRTQILAITKQVTISGIDGAQLKGLTILVPPLPEQNQIVLSIREQSQFLDEGIAKARKQIDTAHEYRTRLIADVVTGKIDVREAAAKLPEAAEPEPLEEIEEVGEEFERAELEAEAEPAAA